MARTQRGEDPATAERHAPSRIEQRGAVTRERDLQPEIAKRAYDRYLSRGAADGQDVDDWLEAERELRDRSPLER